MSTPTCTATGLPLAWWGGYEQRAVEYRVTRHTTAPDGSGHAWTERAGIFCDDSCLAVHLELAAAEDWTPQVEARNRSLPCVRKARGEPEEPF